MRPLRILVVDDEEDLRIIVQLAIALQSDWEAQIVESGEAALEHCRRWMPDAVLLDVMMPGLDGPATLDRLRSCPSTTHLPVIFLTAKSEHDEGPRLESRDVAGVLRKPFDPLGLAGAIARLLDWPLTGGTGPLTDGAGSPGPVTGGEFDLTSGGGVR